MVFITGGAGAGKTTIARNVIAECERELENLAVYHVVNSDEYRRAIKNRKPAEDILIFIDDICGVSTLDSTKYVQWETLIHTVADDILTGRVLIVMTSRLNVIETKRGSLGAWLKAEVNLSSSGFLLSQAEKAAILREHLKFHETSIDEKTIDLISCNCQSVGFPEFCHLFSSSQTVPENAVAFFNNSLQTHLVQEITKLRENDKRQYAILVLTMLCDGSFPVACLENKLSNGDVTIWQRVKNFFSRDAILDQFKANITNIANLFGIRASYDFLRAAKCLSGTLLRVSASVEFQHTAILEATACVYGQDYPISVIERCPLNFLIQRVFTSHCKDINDEISIILPSYLYDNLARRLISELGMNAYKVAAHPAFSDTEFIATFVASLPKFGMNKQSLLQKMRSPKCEATFINLVMLHGQSLFVEEFFTPRMIAIMTSRTVYRDTLMDATVWFFNKEPLTYKMHALRGVYQKMIPDGRMNITSPTAKSKLEKAAKFGDIATLRNLLQKGQSNTDVNMAFYYACEAGHLELAKVLLYNGASIKVTDKYGRTALHMASSNGHPDIVTFLLDHDMAASLADIFGYTPLHWASQSGKLTVVSVLLNRGASINAVTHGGRTCLHLACSHGYLRVAKTLITKGVPVSDMDHDRRTPLHYSCLHGYTDVSKHLLGCGASVSLCDQHGSVPLHYACYFDHVDIVNRILARGSEVSPSDNYGRTPLHYSCMYGNKAVVKYLVDNDAKLSIADERNWYPVHYANRFGHHDVFRYLMYD